MRVEAYRELIDSVNAMVRDFHACVNDAELAAWAKRAAKLRLESWAVEGACSRRTSRDAKNMQSARDRLAIAFHSVEHLVTPNYLEGVQP